MADSFRDTVFGRVVSTISGGRLFKWEEQKNPALLEPYMPNASGASTPGDTSGDEKGDPEKGRDYQLVEFAKDDPEVCRSSWILS